ncbi:MAG: hypothetical protein HXS54_15610 [Theionarchaea archaeon]|nr:hypothetical protein [Theionarchaea archaeon]
MSAKTIYSIRIPNNIHDIMKEMEDIDWQEEIRIVVEEFVRKKRRERLLNEAKELKKDMKSISAAELTREDRDAR